MPRFATLHDAADLARIINDAFIVEAFFKIGDRTSAEEIATLMKARRRVPGARRSANLELELELELEPELEPEPLPVACM